MNKRLLIAAVITSTSVVLSAKAANQILYDFEDGSNGWAAEWGVKQPLTNSTKYSRHGKASLRVDHHFQKKDDNVGVRILFDEPKDFTALPGFAGFSAWVYFPNGNNWEAQIYLHAGDDWKWCTGKLNQNLQPGWYQIFIRVEDITDPRQIRDIGVQIKHFNVNEDDTAYIDDVEAIYVNGKKETSRLKTGSPTAAPRVAMQGMQGMQPIGR